MKVGLSTAHVSSREKNEVSEKGRIRVVVWESNWGLHGGNV